MLLSALLATSPAWAQSPPAGSPAVENTSITRYDNSFEIFQPVMASGGMVASEQRLATLAGSLMLSQGGNAIDAAVKSMSDMDIRK